MSFNNKFIWLMNYDPIEVTKRVIKYADHEGMSDTDLAQVLCITKQHVQKLKKGNTIVTESRVVQLLSLNRVISTDWMLFGEGEMFGAPGVYKANFGADGNVGFEADTLTGSLLEKENDMLRKTVAEKNRFIEVMTGTIENLNAHISKLIEKI